MSFCEIPPADHIQVLIKFGLQKKKREISPQGAIERRTLGVFSMLKFEREVAQVKFKFLTASSQNVPQRTLPKCAWTDLTHEQEERQEETHTGWMNVLLCTGFLDISSPSLRCFIYLQTLSTFNQQHLSLLYTHDCISHS